METSSCRGLMVLVKRWDKVTDVYTGLALCYLAWHSLAPSLWHLPLLFLLPGFIKDVSKKMFQKMIQKRSRMKQSVEETNLES